MTQIFRALCEHGWLSDQPPAFREAVLRHGKAKRVTRRRVIAYEGDADPQIFGVASGSVGIYCSHRHDYPRIGTIIGPGKWFGEGPRMAGKPRVLTFIAAETSVLLTLGDSELRAIAKDHPDLPQRLGHLAEANAQFIAFIVSELLVPQTERRMAAVLLRLCEWRKEPIRLALGQSELGEMMNASRASVSRALKRLETRGLLEVGYGTVTVPATAALVHYLEDSSDCSD